MKTPLIIGITGGIGGGKSTFSRHLREQGWLVFDTDMEAKNLQNVCPLVREKVIAEFGDEVYNANGLDRVKLAQIVFGNAEKLQKLNQIVHPEVKRKFLEWAMEHSRERFLFMECAILFEGGFNELVDKTVLITAPVDVRIHRVMHRDKVTEELVLTRIRNQWPDEEKMKLADWTFNTDNDINPAQRVDDFLKLLEETYLENQSPT